MTLVEFLTARLDERWAAAKAAYDEATEYRVVGSRLADDHFAWGKPAAGMADIEAKRRIIAFLEGDHDWPWWGDPVLQLLALSYADHPDYDPAWKP